MVQSSGDVIALTVVFTCLAIFCVGLRVWSRRVKQLSLGTDDFLILLATFFFVLCLAIPIIIQCARANLGNHVQRTPDGNPIPPSYLFNVTEIIFEATHVIPITLAKCSILFFYKRIFRGPIFKAIVWSTITLAIVWGVSYFFALLFLCTPVSTYVRYGSSAPGVSCVNQLQVYYSLTISDFLIDFIILAIPIPFVWRLQMPLRHKLAVTAIFLMGCLTIAASITRMVTFINAANNLRRVQEDYTYYIAITSYWTIIEASLAITSACLPTLRPLFQGLSPESIINSFRSIIRSNHSTGSSKHSDTSNGSQPGNFSAAWNDKEINSSLQRLHQTEMSHHNSEAMVGWIPRHETPKVTGPGNDRIMVEKSFATGNEAV